MKIAVVLPTWLGDTVMATPTFEALRRHYGGEARLIGVMRPIVGKLLAGTTWFEERVWYQRKSRDKNLGLGQAARRLRELEVDATFVLPNSFATALLARLSGAPLRVGYERDGRGWLLNHGLKPPRLGKRYQPISAVDYYLELAHSVGAPSTSKTLHLATDLSDDLEAERIWRRLDLVQSQQVVLFNTGSANGPSRDWPAERFAKLARWIVANPAASVLVLCGPAERDNANQIAALADHPRVRSMADEDLSLGVMKSVIRRGSMLVTTDSGPRHIAAALGVSTVTLAGPINPVWSHNYFAGDVVVRHPLDCMPCDKNTCPLGHNACMRDLPVDAVFDAVQRNLTSPQRKSA
ncbi:MAG: lipopolysaccharide heptosyltransferase II [Planctomycetales bacterium]|nr:lipopolysaccharide heptosyltransferase II [Planctomycetales bacterium]